MISIVVCSINQERLANLRGNIRNTIGVDYEIIAIDNRVGNRGICTVYNEGGAAARYEILCFVHEDVEFLEEGWGRRLLAHFDESPELGCVGVAGSLYKASFPSGWSSGLRELDRQHLYHGQVRSERKSFHIASPEEKNASLVCVLDGVFICVRRALWADIKFDESISGFHFYDIDFSLRCHRVMKVSVIYDVDILHFSMGGFDDGWLQSALSFHARGSALLPASVGPLPCENPEIEIKVLRFWLRTLRKKKLSRRMRLRWLYSTPVLRYPKLWWLSAKFIFL